MDDTKWIIMVVFNLFFFLTGSYFVALAFVAEEMRTIGLLIGIPLLIAGGCLHAKLN